MARRWSAATYVSPALLALLLIAPPALAARHHAARTPASAVRTASVKSAASTTQADASNPLLPPPLPSLDRLFPDLTVPLKQPEIAPAGITPDYTAADWQAYRVLFGQREDSYLRQRASARTQLALDMIAAATQAAPAGTAPQPGLRRLLLLRAVAVAYRQRAGTEAASQAVADFRKIMDTNDLAQVAAYYTITEAMTRYASTPKDVRATFSAEAARANIQLAMMLLDKGQVAAAEQVTHRLGRHEVAIRHDENLRRDAAISRSRTRRTAEMMDYLAEQARTLPAAGGAAALPLYLYARIVHPAPGLAQELRSRPDAAAVADLEGILQRSASSADGAFYAGQAVRAAARNLPDGLLRDRVLYAALEYYRTYMAETEVGTDRVKRTLSRLAIQDVLVDGAQKPKILRPLDEAQATQAAAETGDEHPSG